MSRKKLTSSRFISNETDIKGACVYNDDSKTDATCIYYSKDPNRTAYCYDPERYYNDTITGLSNYFYKYPVGSCPHGNPFCDKAITDERVCEAYTDLKKAYQMMLDIEDLYPENLGKPYTELIKRYKARCYWLPWWLYLWMIILSLFSAVIPLLL